MTEKADILAAISARIAVMANGKPLKVDTARHEEIRAQLKAKLDALELASIEEAAQEIEAVEQRQSFGSFS